MSGYLAPAGLVPRPWSGHRMSHPCQSLTVTFLHTHGRVRSKGLNLCKLKGRSFMTTRAGDIISMVPECILGRPAFCLGVPNGYPVVVTFLPSVSPLLQAPTQPAG